MARRPVSDESDGLTVVTSDDFRFVTFRLPGMPDIRMECASMPSPTQAQCLAYGVNVIGTRTIAGMKKAGESFAAMHRRINYRMSMLRMGQWSANESGFGPDFVAACGVVRGRNETDAQVMEWLASKTDDEKRAIRARADVTLAMANIVAERARAAVADNSSDPLGSLD